MRHIYYCCIKYICHTNKSELTEIKDKPILLCTNLLQCKGFHSSYKVFLGPNIVLQLHIKRAFSLSIGHEEGKVQILFRSPYNTLMIVAESIAQFWQIWIKRWWWRYYIDNASFTFAWKSKTKCERKYYKKDCINLEVEKIRWTKWKFNRINLLDFNLLCNICYIIHVCLQRKYILLWNVC